MFFLRFPLRSHHEFRSNVLKRFYTCLDRFCRSLFGVTMKYFLYSIIGGLLFGLCNIVLKVLSGNGILYLIINPLFIFSYILGSLAIILNQIALKNLKSSIVTLIIAITTTIISVIGGKFLGEIINIYESTGIVLMILSISIILLNK